MTSPSEERPTAEGFETSAELRRGEEYEEIRMPRARRRRPTRRGGISWWFLAALLTALAGLVAIGLLIVLAVR